MIWNACKGEDQIQSVSGKLYRLVESQEQVATLSYVDSLEEQSILEELIDSAKPSYPIDSEGYHYLLRTPFRYPPIKWGSRFGRTYEPSLFYGGKNVEVCLIESAYYRFIFWYSMQKHLKEKPIRSEHTLFSTRYKTDRGIKLQSQPFNKHRNEITHKSDYRITQQLGTEMRRAGIEAFETISARDDSDQGVCVGLFDIQALPLKKPIEMTEWLCELNATTVAYKQRNQLEVVRFPLTNFLVNGVLPMPSG